MNDDALPPPPRASSRSWFIGLLIAATLFLALRFRWMGHLLMWDEAMNLCSVRAFVSGGHDAYSAWFWRYPPLFNLLLTLLQPLKSGFAARAEWIPVVIGLAQLGTLAALNRRVFGAWPALISGLALCVMPGSIFFGLWIKQDNLMVLAGLMALLFCAHRKWIPCGIALGIALLSKQTAVFYAVSIGLLLLGERRYRELAIVTAVSALVSAWWYVGFGNSTRQLLSFAASGTAQMDSDWQRPWSYYFHTLPQDLGGLGVALAAAGLLVLARSRGMARWPIALFIPAFVVLCLARGKTPWYLAPLFPALATMQAAAACAAWSAIRRGRPRWFSTPLIPVVAAFALTLFIVLPQYGRTYEEVMHEREPGMWRASTGSHEAALALNHLVRDGQKAMITPMHFYGEGVKEPCPIFVIYLKDMPVRVEPNTLSEAQFVDAVREYNLDWAMVSPPPGRGERELIEPLMRDHGLRPLVLRDAVIFNTASLR